MAARSAPPTLPVLRIVWVAMLVSIGIYFAVLWVALRGSPPVTEPLEATFKNPVVLAMYVVALADFLIAFALPRLLIRPRENRNMIPPVPGTVPIAPETIQAFVIQYAMFESVAIFGLIAAFLTRDLRLFFAPAGLAVLGLLLRAPSEDRLREAA